VLIPLAFLSTRLDIDAGIAQLLRSESGKSNVILRIDLTE